MAKQSINVGATANDKKGDSLRAAFQKVNANFTELYTALGLNADTTLNLGAFEFTGSTMSTTDSTAIVIDQAVTVNSNLTVGGDLLPQTSLGGTLGNDSTRWHSIFVGPGSVYIGGAKLSLVDGKITADVGFDLTGSAGITADWPNITNKPTFATVATSGSYSDLSSKPTIPTDINDLTDNTNLLGSNPFDQDLNSTDNPQFNRVGLTAGEINVVPGTGFNLYTTPDGVVSYNLNFDTSGNLNIPGDIRSQGNINIDINLSDSTLRRWQFGEDGGLTFPDGTTFTGSTVTSPVNENVARIDFNLYSLYGNPDPLSAELSTVKIVPGGIETSETNVKIQTVNSHGVSVNDIDKVVTIGDLPGNETASFVYGDSTPAGREDLEIRTIRRTPGFETSIWISPQLGDYKWRFSGEDGSLTVPGNIRSESNINIDINLSDSTLRRWRFGEDGNLNLAGHLQFPVGAEIRESGDGELRIRGAAGEAAQLQGLNTDGFVDSAVKALYNNSVGSFVTIHTNIDAGAPEYIWSFDYNGDLTFPDDTVQNTAFTTSPTLNILKIDDGVHEKFQTKADATGVVTHDCALGHIFYHTSPDANWTVNLTNLNLSEGYATTVTIIIDQGGTGYYPNALQINGGSSMSINWQGNATPTPSTNRTDVVSFSILALSEGYLLLGQLTGF